MNNQPAAQLRMGERYRDGELNELDFVEAYAFFNLAARKLPEATLERNKLELSMSRQKISAAQRRSQHLRGQIESNKKKE